jgi:phenylacetic acid degradation operon negative regulatory protein
MTYQQLNSRPPVHHPQQVVLTLYGDYILRLGGEIGIDALIKLLANFGLSQQAVRSAISRMSRKGLIKVRRVGRRSYYSLTKNGRTLLTKGARRIFKRKTTKWDGNWNIVTYSVPERTRETRDTLRRELGWLGYGPLSEATWISPYDMSAEVNELAEQLHIKDCVQIFTAKYVGSATPKSIVNWCWDLDRINRGYVDFIAKYRPKLEYHLKRLQAGENVEPSECFVERFNLIHEYRKLPYLDPDLPQELLPANWLRPQAAAIFDKYHNSLTEKANEYFDSVSKNHYDSRKALTEHKATDKRPYRRENPPSAFPPRTGAKRSASKSK